LQVSNYGVVVVVVDPRIDEVVDPPGVDVDEVPAREVGVREVVVDAPAVREVVVVEADGLEAVVDDAGVDFLVAVVVVGVVGRAGVAGAIVVGEGVGTAL
jgi:hypothetical protein